MSHFLPPALLSLFAPRYPLPFKPPVSLPGHRGLTGVANMVQLFTPQAELEPLIKAETPRERRARINREKAEANAIKIAEEIVKWNPEEDNKDRKTENAMKTLFVGRLSFEATETDIRKEFERYGSVRTVKLVVDKKGKPRGYAFVEFEHSQDLKDAYKSMDGRRILNKRVVVDIERGRTVPNWRPRRLGGGLGGTRIGSKFQNITNSGRYAFYSFQLRIAVLQSEGHHVLDLLKLMQVKDAKEVMTVK